jgi:hypothetical protein
MGSLDPYPDQDPGGQTHFLKSCSLDISKLQFLIQRKIKQFSAVFFSSVFGHQNPGSGFTGNAGSGSGFNESGSTALIKIVSND